MVRRYKKKPFYEASKIPQATVFKVVAGYTMGMSAQKCADQVGISRQSVQKIFTDIGERVEWLLDGNFPTSNNKMGDFLTKFGDVAVFNQILDLLKEKSGGILSQYGSEISYEDFKNYRDTGTITVNGQQGQEKTATHHFFRYRILNLLIRLSEKNYGIRETQYPRHYAFCKLYYLVLTVMMSQTIHETNATRITQAQMHEKMLSQVDEDKRNKLESMIFEAKCNMVLCMLLIFSLYEEAI